MSNLERAEWRKSTYSALNGCVEVALLEDGVAVRDSKDRGGPVLTFSDAEWRGFVQGVRDGAFELATLDPDGPGVRS